MAKLAKTTRQWDPTGADAALVRERPDALYAVAAEGGGLHVLRPGDEYELGALWLIEDEPRERRGRGKPNASERAAVAICCPAPPPCAGVCSVCGGDCGRPVEGSVDLSQEAWECAQLIERGLYATAIRRVMARGKGKRK